MRSMGTVACRCSLKLLFLKFLKISQETLTLESFSVKLQALRPATLLKRNSSTGFIHVKLLKFSVTFFLQCNSSDCLHKLINCNTKVFWEKCSFTGWQRSYLEGLGFVTFEKLKYQAGFKVVETSTVKQPCPQSNFKTIAKRCFGDKDDIKGLIKSTFHANPSSDL